MHLMTVYDGNNTNVFDKIEDKKLSERFIKLNRIKRSAPPGTTTISHTSSSSTSNDAFFIF